MYNINGHVALTVRERQPVHRPSAGSETMKNKDQRLITTAYTGAGTLSYTYEPVSGRILTLTDSRGVTQYRYYPITGRLHEKENPDATVETYTYDQYGRLHSRGAAGRGERGQGGSGVSPRH